MLVYQTFFYIKDHSKLADEYFLKHKSDKNIFFLQKYSTYGFILNSGQQQDYSRLRNKNQNNKINCKVNLQPHHLIIQGRVEIFTIFKKMPITMRFLLKKKIIFRTVINLPVPYSRFIVVIRDTLHIAARIQLSVVIS